MSFYRVFKPTKEAMEKIPKQFVCDYKDIKESLMANCMIPTDMLKARKEIDFNLNYIYSCIQSEVIEDAHKQFEKDGEISYCGWEYNKDYPSISEEDLKELTKRQLSILKSIVRTPDYFEEEDKFYKKLNDITNIIEDFIDSCYSVARFEIIEKLKDFDVTYVPTKEDLEGKSEE